MLTSLQADFLRCLLSNDIAQPANFKSVKPRALAIYKNNNLKVLQAALKEVYSVCVALVGEHCFNQLSKKFILANPSTAAHLNNFGAEFADFVATNNLLPTLSYIVDTLRLEWLVYQALIGTDATNLSMPRKNHSLLQNQDVIWRVVANGHLLHAHYQVDRIWEFCQPDNNAPSSTSNSAAPSSSASKQDLTAQADTHLFIWRDPRCNLHIDRLSQDEYIFLQYLQSPQPFSIICEELLTERPNLNIIEYLPAFVKRGYFSECAAVC